MELIILSLLKISHGMKNFLCFALCNLLLIALVILTSCSRREGGSAEVKTRPDTTFCLPMSEDSVHKIVFTSKDSVSPKSELARRSQKDLIRWATLGGM
jgi:hypothetical protein